MILSVDNLHVNFTTGGGILEAVRGVGFDLDEGRDPRYRRRVGQRQERYRPRVDAPHSAEWGDHRRKITYRGRDVASLGAEELRAFRGRDVAMIFQEPGRSFDPIYSIGRSLAETLRAHEPELSDEDVRARSIQLLEEVHVSNPESRLDNFPHQFSGGLLQRIMIAHALAGDPAILIADEPTTALDVTIQAGVIDLLRELRRRRGLAIIFITHNLALISGFADRLVVMYAGMVMEEGPVAEVIGSPRHPYTAGLLGSLVPFGAHHSEHPLQILSGTPPDPTRHAAGCPFAPRCPLVSDACRTAVPEIREDAGVQYRCVVDGVKTVNPKDGGAQ